MARIIIKTTIGRREEVNIPPLRLYGVDAKIDTGAYGCAIHCKQIEEKTRHGKKYLSFVLLDPEHPQYNGKKYKVEKYSFKKVKNSFGQVEKRYVINSRISLFGQTHDIEFSLTDRSEMKYPILLGRTFLKGKFIVDVDKYNLSRKAAEAKLKAKPKKKIKKSTKSRSK